MKIPDRKRLIELAGERVFSRGEEYFAWRRIHALASDGEKIAAFVYGGRRYRVTIKVEGEAVVHECDCPEGTSGRFCKHCVAVCLGWQEAGPNGEPSSVNLQDVRGYLGNLPAEDLARLVSDEALRNAEFRERLYLRMARAGGKKPDTAEYRRLIEFVSQTAASECDAETFCAVLGDVESSLNNLLMAGYAEEAASLIEEAPVFCLPQQTEAGERLIAALLSIHQRSCLQLSIAAESLAARLLRWQVSAPANGLGDVVQRYTDLLGLRGRKEYARLVRSEWDRLRSNGDAVKPDQRPKFERLTELLEQWAEFQGDADLLIAVKSYRLDDASDYLAIARLCKRKGREEAAMQWAVRGKNIFQANESEELYEFLAAEYEARGERRKALEILFELFSERPSLDCYQRMAAYARQIGEWNHWRGRALSAARRNNTAPIPRLRSSRASAPDRSALVSILIWEDDIQAALQEARKGECNDYLWQELAKRLASANPDEALNIYKRLVTKYAGGKNGYSYQRAIDVIRRAGHLMKKQKRRDEFLDYVKTLRQKYRYQHSLAKLLDRLLAKHSQRRVFRSES